MTIAAFCGRLVAGHQLVSSLRCSCSSSVAARMSSEPLSIHQRFTARRGFDKHTNKMNISTPWSATNISTKANGVMTGAFAVECVTDEIISIDIQMDVDANSNDTFLALMNNPNKKK